MRRLAWAGPLALIIVAAIGAGILFAGVQTRYSFDKTAACIDTIPASTGMTSDVDYLAQTAKHAEATDLEGNHLTLLEASPDIRKQYETLGAGGVDQHANLLAVWDDPPTSEQQDIVSGCLQ